MSPEVLIAFIAACILLGADAGAQHVADHRQHADAAACARASSRWPARPPALPCWLRAAAARHELGDGVHVGVVRRDPLGRRALSRLPRRPPAVAVLAAPPQSAGLAAAGAVGAARNLPAGPAGQPVEPQGAAVPRRLPAAVRRSARGPGRAAHRCWPCCSSPCWPLSTSATPRRRQGADHLRCGQAAPCSTAPPASSCCRRRRAGDGAPSVIGGACQTLRV